MAQTVSKSVQYDCDYTGCIESETTMPADWLTVLGREQVEVPDPDDPESTIFVWQVFSNQGGKRHLCGTHREIFG